MTPRQKNLFPQPIRTVPELVAPAGSIDSFWAALEAGADAVYMGLPEFNARKRARNFTLDEFQTGVLVAHKRGKRVYAALNTLITDEETPAFLETVSFLHETGADAVIIQDFGALHLLRSFFPSLRVHASTQMFCHNSQQAQFLKNAGLSRIVLARELSIAEQRTLSEKVPLEYEIFVHGAMCFAFSGCCLFSAELFHESGNRGQCRQPCRMRMGRANAPFPFSMKDLCAGTALEQLLETKPAALKIEGRQKNAAYVSEVVAFYRKAIDAYKNFQPIPVPEFSPGIQRKTGVGYFLGSTAAKDLIEPFTSGIGRKIGMHARIRQGHVFFEIERPLQKGSRLRVQDESGRNYAEGTLLSFSQKKKGRHYEIDWNPSRPITAEAYGELSVYFLGDGGESGAVSSLRDEVRGQKPHSVRVNLKLTSKRLLIRIEDVRLSVQWQSESIRQIVPDKTIEMNIGKIEALFRETAETPFCVSSLSLELEKAEAWTYKELKNIRRSFYASYAEFHARQLHSDRIQKRNQLAAIVSGKGIQNPIPRPESVLIGLSSQPPLPGALLQLPLFVPEEHLGLWHGRIRSLIDQGYTRWVLPTYGWLSFFSKFDRVEIYCGEFFYAGNILSRNFFGGWKPAGIIESADKSVLPDPLHTDQPQRTRTLLFTRITGMQGPWDWRGMKIRHIDHGTHGELVLDG